MELPLGRENLSIDSRDLDSSIQAGLVMRLDNVATINLTGPDTTVVRPLRTRETSLGPPVWVSIKIEESILLLQSEPRLLILVGLHDLRTFVAMVKLVRRPVRIPALGQDKDVVALSEWIWEYGYGAEVDVRIFTRSLTSGGAVKVPFRQIFDRRWLLEDSLKDRSVS